MYTSIALVASITPTPTSHHTHTLSIVSNSHTLTYISRSSNSARLFNQLLCHSWPRSNNPTTKLLTSLHVSLPNPPHSHQLQISIHIHWAPKKTSTHTCFLCTILDFINPPDYLFLLSSSFSKKFQIALDQIQIWFIGLALTTLLLLSHTSWTILDSHSLFQLLNPAPVLKQTGYHVGPPISSPVRLGVLLVSIHPIVHLPYDYLRYWAS